MPAGWLLPRLAKLKERQGTKVIEHWHELAEHGQWPLLVEELLTQHYDPLYRQSQGQNYTGVRPWPTFEASDLSEAGIADVAARMLRAVES